MELGASEGLPSGQSYLNSIGNDSSRDSGKGAKEIHTCYYFKKPEHFMVSCQKLAKDIEAHRLLVGLGKSAQA